MNKLKPYLMGAVVGIFGMVIFAGGAYLVYKSSKSLIEKAKTKLSNMRFDRIKKATTEFVICDFETPEDFKKFSDSSAEVALSKDYVSSGVYCAQVTFKAGKSPSFRMEDYFEKDKSFANWAPFGSLLFDIYNPSDAPQRLILQVKDKSDSKYKQDIHLEPNSKETVEVETARLRHSVSIYNIAQINLFRWEPKADAVLYIDNFRLAPMGTSTKKSIFDEEFLKSTDSVYATGDYFAFRAGRWAPDGDQRIFPIRTVNPMPLRVVDFPARGGIPFPKGELTSADQLEIRAPGGKSVPFQSKTMALWPDGSIKWLLLDFPADSDPAAGGAYVGIYPVKKEPKKEEGMLEGRPDSVIINTGKIKALINRKSFRLFEKVWLWDREVVSEGSDMTIRFRGQTYRSSLDKDYVLTVEENGPLVAGLKAEGWFVSENKKKFCKFIVRIKAYKNESFLRVFHTFIYTGYPENQYHYLYKGKRLPKNETIEEVALDVRMPELIKDGALTFAADGNVAQMKDLSGNVKILQLKDDQFKVVKNEKEELGSGQKLEGWADVSGNGLGLSVAVRKLWQQFPKGFEVDPKNSLFVLKLWPCEAGTLDLKTTKNAYGPEAVARGSAFGLGKTHELTFYFHRDDYKKAGSRALGIITQEPLVVMADPAWISDTRVMGAVADYAKGVNYFQKYEDGIERLFDWGDRQKKTFRWYGMLDFGDTLSWYRNADPDNKYDEWGWHPIGRWGWFNCEGTGIHMGALLQFLRTGQFKYLEFGGELARHLMDIDICHFNTVKEDKRLRGIYEDYSQPGSMHRHNGDHWGGRNEEVSHTNLNGILLYYYITGDDRAFDVAKEVGEWFLKHPITYFQHPDIAPHRGLANILMGEVVLFEATQDDRYKKDADFWANLFYQGQNRNGSFNEDYNPRDKRWDGDPHNMYMSWYTLPALIDYHKMTGNPAVKEAIVKLTAYLVKHDEYMEISGGLAYSYFLTGDKKFLEVMESRLNTMMGGQRRQDDPLWNGMIYQKLFYARVVEFLNFTPYAFEALLDQQNKNE